MSAKCTKGTLPLTESRGQKSFICRVVEGTNGKGVLKIPSAIAVVFGSMGLKNIALHLPMKNTLIGRYVSSSETVEGIDCLMEYYNVNPYFVFVLEYIGGTEFTLEIFNEYAVEVDYSSSPACGRKGVFDLTEIQKNKILSTFSHEACSCFDFECDFVITKTHLEGRSWTEVLSRKVARNIGLSPKMDWLELGLKSMVWKFMLQWDKNGLLFDSEWTNFTKALDLQIGDKCKIMLTERSQRFNFWVFQKHAKKDVYKHGNVEEKGLLKWFRILNWISVHVGEVEVPYVFAELYGHKIDEYPVVYLPDGMVYRCYFSKTSKLLFGLKTLMTQYGFRENYTIFFDYIGNSTFYASIYNEDGMEIFNELPQKLSAYTVITQKAPEVIVLSDTDEEEEDNPMVAEGRYNFSVKLLKSHVDANNHGVFLPRYMHDLYKKWNKSTMVTLIMQSKSYKLHVLRRKKTCRLGVGWNDFTILNNLEEGQKLNFEFRGNTKFRVTASY
ncbi:hypothetical protein ACET3Z_024759 [Daucus carota]